MAIHHDKMAYGKLASTREELSDDKILAMLDELNQDEEEEEKTKNKAKTSNDCHDGKNKS